jgi:hypothetical protein
MPTQRAHGGAPILPIPLVTPGFLGLNKQEESSILGPEWAINLLNAVIDDTGRIASRKGWVSRTSTPVGDVIKQTFEFIKSTGITELISSTDNGLYTGITAPTDITGALTITDGNWKFMNFADIVIGIQQGEAPIFYNGAGNFAEITPSGAALPTGDVGVASFGRVFITSPDKTTVHWSALLDETNFDTGDSGSVDMTSVWPKGTDTITALAAHNGQLVVFGKEQVVTFVDPNNRTASDDRGLDPNLMQLQDTITGVGCVARDSVQAIKGDLWFLSDFGIISLGRLIQERSAPLSVISKQVQDYLIEFLRDQEGSLEDIRSVYSPRDRLYVVTFPASTTSFAFDTRGLTPDGDARASTWSISPPAMAYTRADEVVTSFATATGELGVYDTYTDNGESYQFVYESGWLSINDEVASYLKIAKRIRAVLVSASAITAVFKWWWDFEFASRNYTVTLTGDSADEWSAGVGELGYTGTEWNDGFKSPGGGGPFYDFLVDGQVEPFEGYVAGVPTEFVFEAATAGGPPETEVDDEYEWSGGASLRKINVPASGTGQYLRIGIVVNVSGSAFGIQQMDIITKIGRYA